MRIVVVGAAGQLGAAVVDRCRAAHDVVALDRRALDLADSRTVMTRVVALRPDVVVNCAAYNAVDAAEDHPIEALQANAFGVRALARAAIDCGACLVHYSTDFVFDGRGGRPYTEQDEPNPQGVYAASKLLGEWFAADVPEAYVLRVESLFGRAPGGPPARGSAEAIIAALREGRVPLVFEDRTVSPTYIPDAAEATLALLEQRLPAGLYHLVCSGHATWLEFALEAARRLGVPPRVDAVKVADVALRANRPQYCALSNAKLAAQGIAMPTWSDALARYLANQQQ
ncbi:MAG: dTDP-4-dehydrorhamnose reductase [Acidobacteria bacterium]|nr:dTDP-4-dehydrorhamnose reductase [Acidobacteriota bacterium]